MGSKSTKSREIFAQLLFFHLSIIRLISGFSLEMARGNTDLPIYVIFGRPGSGKSTVANAVMDQAALSKKTYFSSQQKNFICNVADFHILDLDVCIPQWMKDNFNSGKYPTKKERVLFAEEACNYVESCLAEDTRPGAVISFSFVNTDLRDYFRARFENTVWFLIDSSEALSEERISGRDGHFYKGKPIISSEGECDSTQDVVENGDWNFAPVTFPHVKLDGKKSITANARMIITKIVKDLQKLK